MNDYIKPKLDFEPTNEYDKAKMDLINAINSFSKLTQQQQQKLAYEIFGAQAVSDLMKVIHNYNNR